MTKQAWRGTFLLLILGGCGAASAGRGDELEPEDRDPSAGLDGKFEAWNSANNPAFVDSNFLYYVHQLPTEGHGPIPIPGDYWATANDNLNYKWDGAASQSAAQKYGQAFGRADTPEQVSLANGVKSAAWRKACQSSSDCSDQMDGSQCATSYDGQMKRCIPGWWGICHGWAPYALSEPAAKSAVTKNGVTFYPGDLEGLMSMLYTDVATKFLSSRCDKAQPPTDSLGRLIDGECRDMNPGSWHVLVTNMMGLRQQGFVLDQTYDEEVWNQPAYGFKITNATGDKVPEISKDEAISILGLNLQMTSLLPTTEIRKDEQRQGEFAAQAAGNYTVKLTGTGDVDLYVKRGSAPTLESYDCRPYTGTSVEECAVPLQAGEKLFWLLNGYSASSSVQLGIAIPGQGGEYAYNTSAKRFYYVEMDFTFIVESQPGRSSHIDQALGTYASTKRYSYVLEADENNRVVGGEWTGASRTRHPDFAWWPTGKPSVVAGISYADVKALSDQAAGAQPLSDELTVIDDYSFSGSSWSSRYAEVVVEPGVRTLEVKMNGTGDADLYVRRGANPTIYVYGCRSATVGSSTEVCSLDVPSDGGSYIVRARSKTPGTTVTVTTHKIR